MKKKEELKNIKILTDPIEQVEMLTRGMKKIVIGSPMDYEEIAKQCLEQLGIDTKNKNNFKVL